MRLWFLSGGGSLTTNVIIAFGGVFLLGIIAIAFVWLTSAAAQRKEPPGQEGTPSDAQPRQH